MHSIASIASADNKFLGCIEFTAICLGIMLQNIAIVCCLFHSSFVSLIGWFHVSGHQRYTTLFMVLATLLILTIERILKLLTMPITSSFVYCLSYSLSYCPYIIALYACTFSLPLPKPRAHTLIHYFLTASCKQTLTSTLFLALIAPANHITASSKRSSHPCLGLLPYSSTLSSAVELVLTVCSISKPPCSAAMASPSSQASYVSPSPQSSPIQNTGGLSTYQFPSIHHTNTGGLSLLLGMYAFFCYVSSSLAP